MIAQRVRCASSEPGDAELPLGLDPCPQESAVFDCVAVEIHRSGLGSQLDYLQGHNVFPVGPESAAAYLTHILETDLRDNLWIASNLDPEVIGFLRRHR